MIRKTIDELFKLKKKSETQNTPLKCRTRSVTEEND